MGDARTKRGSVVLRRYGAGVALPLALLAGAGWVWAHAPEVGSTTRSGSPEPAAPRATGEGGTRPSPTPSRPSKPTPAPKRTLPHATPTSRAPSGPGINKPGVHLRVTPTPDGALEVSERVVLATELTRLTLRPPDVGAAGRDFRTLRPVALQVQLTVDGQPVAVDSGTVSTRQVVVVGRPSLVLELRYVLSGSTVRSVPSVAGRSLAAVAPLVSSADAPVVVSTQGDSVLNLTCPELTGDARVCSDGVRGAMTVRAPLPVDRALVVLQLDLPRP